MKICVLGAGVIGVSTAYALGRLGHDVSVIEKAPDVARGASYANGAQLSYSYIDPLASPSTLKKLPRYLLGHNKALSLRFAPSINYMRWGLSFLRNCSSTRFTSNRADRHALAELSREALNSFERDMPNAFNPTGRGKLVLAQSEVEYEDMKADKDFVSKERCLEVEPSLVSWTTPIWGGVYAQEDYALNTLAYCQNLKTAGADKFGVTYYFNETITKLEFHEGQVIGVETDKCVHRADKVIICLGNEALMLLKPLGIKLPIYAGQGYSLTLNAKGTSPQVSVTDLKNKIVYASLGDKVRIAGFVDINQRTSKIAERLDLLKNIAKRNWPNVADFDGPIETWTGARPMMPSGVPVIGESPVKGIYLNLGHGSLGYTFAAGSAMKIGQAIGHARKNAVSMEQDYHVS